MTLNLRNKFLIPTIILVFSGMILLAALCGFATSKALTNNVNQQIQEVLDLTNQRITTYIKDRIADVMIWSQIKTFQEAAHDTEAGRIARKAAQEYLTKLQSQSAYFENVAIANTNGDIMAASVHSAVGKVNVKDRAYFKASIDGKDFVSTDVVISRSTGNPGFMISAPIQEDGKVLAVLYGTVAIHTLNEQFMDPVRIGKEGYAFMFQRDGNLISHPDKSLIMKLNARDHDFMHEMMSRGEGTIHYSFKGRNRMATFRVNKETNWTLAIGASKDEMFAPVMRIYYISALVLAGVLLVTVITLIMVSNAAVKPIKKMAAALRGGAEQVASASNQVSKASQQLAEGASQQAVSIEETSSSLEEMSSMTRQNAENSGHANALVGETVKVVTDANHSMNELTSAMDEITRASEETSKIIRTIDEIAFQTNLLALNAAVEAARAGEAGAGFAVVADEVRNLAMRAAGAAKNTAGLIEETVNRVRGGADIVRKTSTGFSLVATKAQKMEELIAEITAASSEQAQGIEQVNKAVGEMDEVVQQNVSNAEESAAASEELNAQAKSMKAIVVELTSLVGENTPAPGSRKLGAPDGTTGAMKKTMPGRGEKTGLPARTA